MIARLGAAICGVVIMLACSSTAMAKFGIAGEKTAKGKHAHSAVSTVARHTLALGKHTGATIVGAASMYNPYQPGYRSGGPETASGEVYDPTAWTAAIQIDLRQKFRGVHYGEEYEPAFALVESADKRAIIKINDVGPLKPGRIIDFNLQTMRYFDPSLQLGLVANVKVTPLPGDNWTAGPIEG
jgi:rare lipoprotein A